MMSYFIDTITHIEGNKKLRKPQIEAYLKIKEYFQSNKNGEALVVLPTGTGKSGLISIAPFGVAMGRVLIITPGLVTKKSVIKTLHPLEDNFWINYDVLFDLEDIPVVEEYDPDMMEESLNSCNFVITNIHRLNKDNPRSLIRRVPPNFFDMVIIDEAHHAPAETWKEALCYFKDAKKLHVTGTPYRGDHQELPGEEIHNTKLSEVMAFKYVKWLRKHTVNNSSLYFSIPGDSKQYSKDEVLEFKEKDWVERSVALSKECSMDVVEESIKQLHKLKEASPNVNHKILAVACGIPHATDLAGWYEAMDKKVVIVHSGMPYEALETNLLKIENHECDVVVSVNMLMEGYDHKYLTVLALFRPYRSLNAFAQIVGRVLRAIPDDEITDFSIDNNAVVIYHEEIGLDSMWEFFSKEVEISKKLPKKEYEFSDREYRERQNIYADIEKDEYYVSGIDSYMPDIDFNALFESARQKTDKIMLEKIKKLKEAGLSDAEIEAVKSGLRKTISANEKLQIDKLLIEKRPELARKTIRDILYTNSNEVAQAILQEKGLDPKECSLYNKFRKLVYGLDRDTCNDGILVRYINTKVSKKYGPVKTRTPDVLLSSQKYMSEVAEELRRMI